jgi:hypothetical protein
MPETNDDEWGLCDHGPYLPADYLDDEEDYDDEAEVEALARLAAEVEPGRATVAQWAQAIRRLGEQRGSRGRHDVTSSHSRRNDSEPA